MGEAQEAVAEHTGGEQVQDAEFYRFADEVGHGGDDGGGQGGYEAALEVAA
jgi:hypothetical protein